MAQGLGDYNRLYLGDTCGPCDTISKGALHTPFNRREDHFPLDLMPYATMAPWPWEQTVLHLAYSSWDDYHYHHQHDHDDHDHGAGETIALVLRFYASPCPGLKKCATPSKRRAINSGTKRRGVVPFSKFMGA